MLLKKTGVLLYKAPPPKKTQHKTQKTKRQRVVIGQYKSHVCYQSCGAKPYIYPWHHHYHHQRKKGTIHQRKANCNIKHELSYLYNSWNVHSHDTQRHTYIVCVILFFRPRKANYIIHRFSNLFKYGLSTLWIYISLKYKVQILLFPFIAHWWGQILRGKP